MQKDKREEIRCCHCGKLLAKGQAREMEFKCPPLRGFHHREGRAPRLRAAGRPATE
ncbi:Com family DNA-binding transcriptional regulator [Desulfovibrio fairfieldensis]|uniref:Com family DNA-binding transcriptional regulator n=1 Tax=Desulfovibrio fairfieldensis TaxID=44742 RepID=UPI0009F871B1